VDPRTGLEAVVKEKITLLPLSEIEAWLSLVSILTELLQLQAVKL
jgi:hypothetical protein